MDNDTTTRRLDSTSPNQQARLDTIRLALIPGIGPHLRHELLKQFGSASAVLSAVPSQLRQVPGIGPELMKRLVQAHQQIDVAALASRCASSHVIMTTQEDATYPRALCELPDPPGVLFVRGELMPQDTLAVAIVGSRHATQYGLKQAHRIAYSLVQAGMTVVSGLARGIDAAAHRGALEAGGRTIAVLASGVCNIYPPEHASLADEIATSGAVISENRPDSSPKKGSFPQRNRLISGLSLGVLVIEAAQRSGALITVSHAIDQGRDVFAMPGRVDSRMSRGCHQLLRDGARLVESADDVIEELGPLMEPVLASTGNVVRHPAELQLNEQEQQVLSALEADPVSIDDIVFKSGLSVHRVLSTISVLEMRRLVRHVSGNRILRV